MTTPEHRIADVLRMVALRLENALDEGRRSARIDANDLLETLLAVADELDPPVADNIRPYAEACPTCGERDSDRLVWDEEGQQVICAECGTTYRPGN